MTSPHNVDSHPGSSIVVCYDGSPGAARALRGAGTLFPGQPAVIVYIRPQLDAGRIHTTSVTTTRAELIEEVRVADRREAEAVAEEGVTLAVHAGLKARPLTVETTHPIAYAILQVVMNETAAAVVIGRTARITSGPSPLGSVTRSVVDNCLTPVVVV